MSSRVFSMRLRGEQVERLRRVARRMGRTPSDTGALLIEEALRRAEFALIDFRDSPVGRQAYVQGSTLAVWEVVSVARDHGFDAAAAAQSLSWPESRVMAALNYAEAHRDEIDAAIADNDAICWTDVSRLVPGARMFEVAVDGG